MTKTIEQELEFEMLVRFAINIYEFETEKTEYERTKKNKIDETK